MRAFIILLLTGILYSCAEEKESVATVAEEQVAQLPETDTPAHLGGCILMDPRGKVPEDLYAVSEVMPTTAISPFTKELQVYGLALVAQDNASDDFMRLVAKTIVEIFPQRDDLDLSLQREVIANQYRYRALIPVPLGDDFSFMEQNAERWAELESEYSICDIIMQDVPARQVMEVVEHILHYVSDIGLHYTFPDEWGIHRSSKLAVAMQFAIDNGYYDVSGYDDIDDAEVRFRVEMQEFAYWFISTAWNLQEPYGPAEEQEWLISNQEELRQKFPAMYEVYERTAGRVMVSPSVLTLQEIGPTWGEEKGK